MKVNRIQGRTKADSKFVGRRAELEKLENNICSFLEKERTGRLVEQLVFSIYGPGGVGKTQILKKSYDELCSEKNRKKMEGTKILYVNLSECYTFSDILVSLRVAFGDETAEAFRKFDMFYEFYYDANGYKNHTRAKNIEDIVMAESKSIDKDLMKWLRENIKLFLPSLENASIEVIDRAIKALNVPLLSLISLTDIVELVKQGRRNENEKKQVIELYKEIGEAYLDSSEKEQRLLQYFVEGARTILKVVLYMDNINTHTGYRIDQNKLVRLIKEYPCIYVMGSRNIISNQWNIENYHEINVKALDVESCNAMLENAIDEVKKYSHDYNDNNFKNKKEVFQQIINATKQLPINLVLAVKVLETELIKAVQSGREPYYIEPKRFKEMANQEGALAYYFESGVPQHDLDCYHALSCLEVWHKEELDIIRKELNISLINALNVLDNDSMTEEVNLNSIKLHEVIKENLLKSANNRIKYDVLWYLYSYKMSVVDEFTSLEYNDVKVLFDITCIICDEIKAGHLKHTNKSSFEVFSDFYKYLRGRIKFEIDIQKRYSKVQADDFMKLYDVIVSKYVEIAKNEGLEKIIIAAESVHEFGIRLSEAGQTEWALGKDEEYYNLLIENEAENLDPAAMANAINSWGYDLSARHQYERALEKGKEAIEFVVKKINENSKLTNDVAFQVSEMLRSLEESPSIEKKEKIITILEDVKMLDKGIVKVLFERVLVFRGNIPWYYINSKTNQREKWNYAVQYGKSTHVLREIFYGKKDKRTLISKHNYGAYLLKVHQLKLCKKEELFQFAEEAYKIFKDVINEKKQYLGESKEILSLEEINERIEKTELLRPLFEENRELLEVENQALLRIDISTLESMQYLSDAAYCLYLITNEEAYIEEAIDASVKVLMSRGMKLGQMHKKTMESLYYLIKHAAKRRNQIRGYNDIGKQLALYLKSARCTFSDEQKDEYGKFLEQVQ